MRIDPEQKLKEARNTQRKSHVSTIRMAIQEFYAKNNRTYPSCLDDGNAYIEDCSELTPKYFNLLPQDPSGQAECYFIEISSIQGVIVTAECAENEEIIKSGQ